MPKVKLSPHPSKAPKKSPKIKKEPSEAEGDRDPDEDNIQAVIEAAKERAKKWQRTSREEPPQEEASSSEGESEEEGDSQGGSDDDSFSLPIWQPYFKGDGSRGFSMILLASRNSGKSYLIKSLLRTALTEHFDISFVICESKDDREEFLEVLESLDVEAVGFDHLPEQLWERVKESYDERTEEGKKPLRVLFLLDDAIGNDIKYSQSVLKIFCMGRHVGASVVWSTQHSKLIDSACKSNADVIGLGKTKSPQQKKGIAENILAGSIENLPEDMPISREKRFYLDVLKAYTQKQGEFLIIDQRPRKDKGNQTEEELFAYKAPKLPPLNDETPEE